MLRLLFAAGLAHCISGGIRAEPTFLQKIDYSGLSEAAVQDLFKQYQVDFEKSYADVAETAIRFDAFQQSLQRITDYNRRDPTAIFGLNPYSDLTPTEFRQRFLLQHHHGQPVADSATADVHNVDDTTQVQEVSTSAGGVSTSYSPASGAPIYSASVDTDCDWRMPSTCGSSLKFVLTPVVNQNACGGCWAYSAVATVESAFALAGYDLTKLSVSQILDCYSSELGCGGGDATYAIDWVQHHGAWTAAAYPDTAAAAGKTSPCPAPAQQPKAAVQFNLTKLPIPWASGSGYSQGKYADVVAKTVRDHGPVSACMNAQWGWHDYVGGVISNSALCTPYWDSVDHCVNIVGYRASPASVASMGQKYWVVRNSWGSSWGNGGYLYISMDSNVCGVLNEVSYAKDMYPGPAYGGTDNSE